MNIKEETICRLCFNVLGNEFEVIDDITKDILNSLLLEIDVNVSKNPVICQDCLSTLKKFHYFKSICVNTVKVLPSFEKAKKETQFKIEDIYEECKNVDGIAEDLNICQFCMNPCEIWNIVSNILMDKAMFMEILPIFMPNLDFEAIKNLIICTSCRENLECYSEFVQNCLNTEAKINTYRNNEKVDSMNQIELSVIMHYSLRDTLKIPDDGGQIHSIKQEIYEEKYIHAELMENENELDIKDEEFSFDDKSVQNNSLEVTISKQDDIFKGKLKEEDIILSDSCNMVAYQTKHMRNSSVRKIVHKNVSRTVTYKYTDCQYETKQKVCFNRHLLSHKDFSEVRTYKCGECNYETKCKGNFDNHVLTHKDTSELEMHKCVLCTFETKYKRSLKTHMVVHKDTSEVKMHKCVLCTFETKYKRSLESHMIGHKDTSELEMFKCTKCPYQTVFRGRFSYHKLTHEEVSNARMLQCALCSYATRRKYCIERHMLTHKATTEMYKCSECAFETKTQQCLKRHKLIHKDISKVVMYKCTKCTFETKHSSNLKSHGLTHKDPSEVEMYKCTKCTFETKHSRSLKSHGLTHKDPSEVEKYKCASCPYETKRKRCLKAHMVKHRGTLEKYKCVRLIHAAKII